MPGIRGGGRSEAFSMNEVCGNWGSQGTGSTVRTLAQELAGPHVGTEPSWCWLLESLASCPRRVVEGPI